MKTNVQQKTALKSISNVLNNSDLLFAFDVEVYPHRTELHILTDKQEVNYTTNTSDEMVSFLQNLNSFSPEYWSSIQQLILEINGANND